MQWLVKYFIDQVLHHKINEHPAMWSGSCFQDLVGARRVEGLRPCFFEVLPRLRLDEVCQMAGLPRGRIEPASAQQVRHAGAGRLAKAAGAALAVGPELQGKTKWVTQARRAVAQIAMQTGIGLDEVAWALDISPKAVRNLLRAHLEEEILPAVYTRLALEDVVAGT